MLNAREWATLILLAVGAALLLYWPRTRAVVVEGIPGILKAFDWRVTSVFVLLMAWIAGCLALAWRVGLFDWSLTKDAAFITATLAIPMTFRIANAQTGLVIVKRLTAETLGLTALIAFYLNVAPFPLWGELVLQPTVALLVAMAAVAGTRAEWVPARKLITVLLGLAGIGALAWTTTTIVHDWASMDWIAQLRSFLISLWLPALLLPLFYVEAFLMTAEVLLKRVSWVAPDRALRRRVCLAIVLGLHFRVKLAARFTGRYNTVGRLITYRETIRYMRSFRADVRRDDVAERARVSALRTNSGVSGADVSGAQRDRREFHATKERLRWISTCEMGRYTGNGNRYWSDADGLTDAIVDAPRYGLPEQHGFVVETSANGQDWRAWRTLPSGWVLGMGGAGWRSEWVFAGDSPPTSWPGGDDPRWVDNITNPDLPPDWERNDEPIVRPVESL